MLNERAEYNALLTNGYQNLLRRQNLCEQLSGLRRPLVVLARGIIEKLDDTDLIPQKKYHLCVEFLKTWLVGNLVCSEYISEIEKYPQIYDDFKNADENNLKSFINCFEEKEKTAFLRGNAKKKSSVDEPKVLTIDDYFNNKINAFSKSMFSHSKSDNQNQIFFNAIIADALNLGRLKDNVLIIKKSAELLRNNDFGIQCFVANRGYFGEPTEEQIKKILAIVFFYLQNKSEGQTFASVCKADISNYLGIRSDAGGGLSGVADFINKGYVIYKNNNEPIFRFVRANGKYSVNQQWMSDFGVKIVPADLKINSDFLIINDNILRKNAKKNKA